MADQRNTRENRNASNNSENNDVASGSGETRRHPGTARGETQESHQSRLDNETSLDTVIPLDANGSSDTAVYKFYAARRKINSVVSVRKADAFIYMIVPPDGGYAWLILVMSFLTQAIIEGLVFSIGVVLPYIAEDQSMSDAETSMIASTQIGVYYFLAPLSSAFINKFGFRLVAVGGAGSAALAILICSFSEGAFMLITFYGVIVGISLGMAGMASSLIIHYYFEKYRPIASGLSLAGSGVGFILISGLNVYMLEHFVWQSAVRTHAVLLIFAMILSLSYRNVQPIQIGQFIEHDDVTEEHSNSIEIASVHYSLYVVSLNEGTSIYSSQRTTAPRVKFKVEGRSLAHRICPCLHKPLTPPDSKCYVLNHRPLDRSDIFYDGPPDYDHPNNKNSIEIPDSSFIPSKEDKARTITYTLSVLKFPVPQPPLKKKKSWIHPNIEAAMNALFDLQLLKSAEYRLLLLVAFLYSMGYNIPFLYTRSRAEIPDKYTNLLPTMIGVTSIVLRISMGFVAQKITFHVAYLSGGGMSLGGSMTLLSGFVGSDDVFSQIVFAICFSIGAASFSTMRAVIYVKVLGLDRLTNAYGLSTMVMGVGVFTGTTIAGILNDYSGGYSASFVYSGTCMSAAAVLKLLLPKYIEHRRKVEARRAQKKVRFAQPRRREKWRRRLSGILCL